VVSYGYVAFAMPPAEVADLRSSLDARGLPQYLSSQLGEVDATLHDASAALGHDIEIHVDCEGLRGFFAMVSAAAEGWDGSEPLRPVES
jgi:methylmalonyl-CoA/ethylmalonyl-CoA epimerase